MSYILTIIALMAIGCFASYLLGRIRGELLITKLKEDKKRIYGILSELRKQYVASMQREKPYRMNIRLDKEEETEWTTETFEKIYKPKATPYSKQGGRHH